MAYFVFMLSKLVKESQKKEYFEEKQSEKLEEKKETFADQMLDKNLFIINTFEDVHERKITKDELKKFSEDFKEDTISKQEMREKIENFDEKKEKVLEEDDLKELLDVSKKLTTIIEKMQKDKSPPAKSLPPIAKGTIESFNNDFVIPFSRDKKYMPIR